MSGGCVPCKKVVARVREARTASQVDAEIRQRAMVADWYVAAWEDGSEVGPISIREARHLARKARQRGTSVVVTEHHGPGDETGQIIVL